MSCLTAEEIACVVSAYERSGDIADIWKLLDTLQSNQIYLSKTEVEKVVTRCLGDIDHCDKLTFEEYKNIVQACKQVISEGTPDTLNISELAQQAEGVLERFGFPPLNTYVSAGSDTIMSSSKLNFSVSTKDIIRSKEDVVSDLLNTQSFENTFIQALYSTDLSTGVIGVAQGHKNWKETKSRVRNFLQHKTNLIEQVKEISDLSKSFFAQNPVAASDSERLQRRLQALSKTPNTKVAVSKVPLLNSSSRSFGKKMVKSGSSLLSSRHNMSPTMSAASEFGASSNLDDTSVDDNSNENVSEGNRETTTAKGVPVLSWVKRAPPPGFESVFSFRKNDILEYTELNQDAPPLSVHSTLLTLPASWIILLKSGLQFKVGFSTFIYASWRASPSLDVGEACIIFNNKVVLSGSSTLPILREGDLVMFIVSEERVDDIDFINIVIRVNNKIGYVGSIPLTLMVDTDYRVTVEMYPGCVIQLLRPVTVLKNRAPLVSSSPILKSFSRSQCNRESASGSRKKKFLQHFKPLPIRGKSPKPGRLVSHKEKDPWVSSAIVTNSMTSRFRSTKCFYDENPSSEIDLNSLEPSSAALNITTLPSRLPTVHQPKDWFAIPKSLVQSPMRTSYMNF